MPASGAWPYPRRVAHRGAGKLAPENTLAAIRLGHAHGYRMAEIDVKLSGDGVAFLMHDATVDRTTDGRGRADALDWRALSQLDAGSWHSAAYAGEPLPTFAAVSRCCRALGLALNVEIKPMPGRERATGAAIAQDALALWHGADVPPVLSSFAPDALIGARDAAPSLPRAFLYEHADVDWRAVCRAAGCIAIDVRHRLVDADLVRAARAEGYRVMAWTVNEPARAAELDGLGVDCVITDAIDRIEP